MGAQPCVAKPTQDVEEIGDQKQENLPAVLSVPVIKFSAAEDKPAEKGVKDPKNPPRILGQAVTRTASNASDHSTLRTPRRGAGGAVARASSRDSEADSSIFGQNSSFWGKGSSPQLSKSKQRPDPVEQYLARGKRKAIFFAFCQGVQVFMSYDGGALPASLDTLQTDSGETWTGLEIGLLGSMDKIGMVAAAAFWGWALVRVDAKILMVVSLFFNAVCTGLFGIFQNKMAMYATRFVMGLTQAFQGVWGTVWTITWAPPELKTEWFGLGAISAGVGNGIGFAIAGFGTANGLPFAFAFLLSAGVLLIFWLALLFVPRAWVRTQTPAGREVDIHQHNLWVENNKGARARLQAMPGASWSLAPMSSIQASNKQTGGAPHTDLSAVDETRVTDDVSLQALCRTLKNWIFLWTALAISLTMFEAAAIQFLWTRVHDILWPHLSKNVVTFSGLIVPGVGSGLGIAFGPLFIDRMGGFSNQCGVKRSLRYLFFFQLVAGVAGGGGICSLFGRAMSAESSNYVGDLSDMWLWLTWLSILVVLGAQNGSVAALCGINVEVMPEDSRTFASGIEMTCRNIFGFVCAPLLPGVVMSAVSDWGEEWEISIGLGFVLACNGLGVLILGAAAFSRHVDYVTTNQYTSRHEFGSEIGIRDGTLSSECGSMAPSNPPSSRVVTRECRESREVREPDVEAI